MSKKTEEKQLNTKEYEKLRQENSVLKERVQELENNWKRALADYQNLQKRNVDDRYNIVAYANQTIILRLLFILDSLEMLENHSDDQGLKLIVKEFKSVLNEEGLSELDVDKQNFDENIMDATEIVEGEDGKVVEVVQKGYKIRDKVLRPAKVKVGKKGGNTNNS